MGTLDLASRIHQALDLDGSRQSATAIKEAVARELRQLDPRIRVTETDYFNHTFVRAPAS
jgi:phage baseplate assembly protein W